MIIISVHHIYGLISKSFYFFFVLLAFGILKLIKTIIKKRAKLADYLKIPYHHQFILQITISPPSECDETCFLGLVRWHSTYTPL